MDQEISGLRAALTADSHEAPVLVLVETKTVLVLVETKKGVGR